MTRRLPPMLLPLMLGVALCLAPLPAGARSPAAGAGYGVARGGLGLHRGFGSRFGPGYGHPLGEGSRFGGGAGRFGPGGRLRGRFSPDYVPGPGVEARGSYGGGGADLGGASGVAVAPGLSPTGDPAP